MTDASKLAYFIKDRLSSELQEVMLTKDASGKYYLFGKYVIVKRSNLYKVYCSKEQGPHDFCSLKSATAWCVLDNAGKYIEARRIENLDLRLSSIDVDIAVHKNKIKRSSNDYSNLISLTKLQQDIQKRRHLLAELDYYIDNSKKIQDKNFRIKDSKIKHNR